MLAYVGYAICRRAYESVGAEKKNETEVVRGIGSLGAVSDMKWETRGQAMDLPARIELWLLDILDESSDRQRMARRRVFEKS